MKRCLVFICLMCMLSACGSSSRMFNLEKEGIAYNYSDKICFYYPRNWEVQTDDLKLSLDILGSNQEGLYFDTFELRADNTAEEFMNLYLTKLKNLGLEIDILEEGQLQSAQPCFFVSGHGLKDDTYFSEVVVFMDGRQYIYSYIASQEKYEKNIQVMHNYLASLVINETQKPA